jgi:cytochrome P450
VIDRCLAELKDLRDADGIVRTDLVPLSWAMLHRISARVVGIDGVDDSESTQRFIASVRKIGEALTVEFTAKETDVVIEQGLAARAAFVEEFFEPSARRRQKIAEEVRTGRLSPDDVQLDLLTLLYLNWDDKWSQDLPLQETTVYIVGAAQTTANALPQFVMHLEGWLLKHPDHRRLVAEDPDFLRRAAGESLRFFIAAPARVRIATEEVVLRSTGRSIAAGQRVALYFRPANSDPDLFGPDADEFNPLRAAKGAPWGLAFGGGAHACPGRPIVVGHGEGDGDGDDGTLVTITRALWQAGLELDSERPPVRDAGTHYDAYSSVPIRLLRI